MPLDHAAQSGSHTLAERGLDLYETPPCATEALLRVERLPHWCWEPAAGRGAIVNVLRDHGHAVIASDIIDYGFPPHFVGDFLKQRKAPAGNRTASRPTRRFRSSPSSSLTRSTSARESSCLRDSPSSNRNAAPTSLRNAASRVCTFSVTACR